MGECACKSPRLGFLITFLLGSCSMPWALLLDWGSRAMWTEQAVMWGGKQSCIQLFQLCTNNYPLYTFLCVFSQIEWVFMEDFCARSLGGSEWERNSKGCVGSGAGILFRKDQTWVVVSFISICWRSKMVLHGILWENHLHLKLVYFCIYSLVLWC